MPNPKLNDALLAAARELDEIDDGGLTHGLGFELARPEDFDTFIEVVGKHVEGLVRYSPVVHCPKCRALVYVDREGGENG